MLTQLEEIQEIMGNNLAEIICKRLRPFCNKCGTALVPGFSISLQTKWYYWKCKQCDIKFNPEAVLEVRG